MDLKNIVFGWWSFRVKEYINGYEVAVIGQEAFARNTILESVTLPNSILPQNDRKNKGFRHFSL